MSEVPTKEITTPKTETKVELKEWITGGDFENFQKELLKGVKVDASGKTFGEIDASIAITQNHKGIELVVVSVNGKIENVLSELLKLPKDDYQFVLSAVNDVTSPKDSGSSVTNTESS